jgi:hypothetical protein
MPSPSRNGVETTHIDRLGVNNDLNGAAGGLVVTNGGFPVLLFFAELRTTPFPCNAARPEETAYLRSNLPVSNQP